MEGYIEQAASFCGRLGGGVGVSLGVASSQGKNVLTPSLATRTNWYHSNSTHELSR